MRAFLSLVILSVLLIGCSAPDLPPSTPTVISSPTFLPPTETSTATQIALNVAPEVKAVLDTQKATYAVNAEGKASIDVASTAEVEQVVLEKVGHTPTNDGLAKDILTGQDKDGVRYIFAENYGWMKDIDLSLATIDSPTEIPWEIAQHQEALNAIFALHYSEDPTISPNAVEPHYWVNAFRDNVYLSLQAILPKTGTPIDQDTRFTSATQPFTKTIVLRTTNPKGQEFVILARTQENPTAENKNQLINLFYWMSRTRYDELVNLPGDYMMNMTNMLSNNTFDIAPVLVPPSQIPWDSNTWLDTGKHGDSLVAGMQEKGRLISLFNEQEQTDILNLISSFYDGPVFGDGQTISITVSHIPEEFALKPLLTNFETWGHPPGP